MSLTNFVLFSLFSLLQFISHSNSSHNNSNSSSTSRSSSSSSSSSNNNNNNSYTPNNSNTTNTTTTTTNNNNNNNNNDSHALPEPRWHFFTILNSLLIPLFISTLLHYFADPSRYSSSSDSSRVSAKWIGGWAVCIGYFFGFLGVGFVQEVGLSDTGSAGPGGGNVGGLVGEGSVLKGVMSADINGKSTESELPTAAATTTIATMATVATTTPTATPTATPARKEFCPPPSPNTPNTPNTPNKPTTTTTTTTPITSQTGEIKDMEDSSIAQLVLSGQVKDHTLEKTLQDHSRAVTVRRLVFTEKLSRLSIDSDPLRELPSGPSLDYSRVFGANCEIVCGYVPLPVGIVGPLLLNGSETFIPMATTEGCLVASTNRGCKAITEGGGATSVILRDGITRAPCLRFASALAASECKIWSEEPQNFQLLKAAFESTTSFGKLIGAEPTLAGRNVYLRLRCFAGDAMGMNMVSKGSLKVVEVLKERFDCELISLSGNMCCDKKASAVNWIQGRGKSVVIEATIPKKVVQGTLKTTVKSIVHTNTQKNLIGSAMSATIGGFNAHAANNVTAVFLACGQDPAQNVESSNCLTLMEETNEGNLWISCTMPSIEVGTVGGGTSLPAQSACLRVLNCKGGGEVPGANAKKLAHAVAGAVMAGELSLLAALAANTLVAAHMQHNRKPQAKTAGK